MLVGKLKHLKRTGWWKRNINECETVSGHMYRMSVMAFLLHDSVPGISKDRCIKMALVHDIAESIVGDLTPFCGVSKDEKHRREMEAMERLCSLVGKRNGEEFFDLFMEYEKQETEEAKAVKDLDKFDMILQAFEYEEQMEKPGSLQEFFDSVEGTFQNSLISKWVQELKRQRKDASASLTGKDHEA